MSLTDSGREASDDDEPRVKLAGFADAMKKLLHRSVNSDGAPVLAKRHTAAEKRVVAERQAAAQAKVVAAERTKTRKAHHSEPSVEPNIVLEKALRRVATIGGVCVCVVQAWRRDLVNYVDVACSCCVVQCYQRATKEHGSGD